METHYYWLLDVLWYLVLGALFGGIGSILLLRVYFTIKRNRQCPQFTIGFFHPYCAAGGGGERVLWCCIKAIQDTYKDIKCVVYTGDKNINDQQMFDRIKNTFNIELNTNNIKFIRLNRRSLVEASTFPRFTLLGQSLGSMVLGMEALLELNPHLFIDTMGYAFTYPIFKILGGADVACYVHYPIVSTDMIKKVNSSQQSHNNNQNISRSKVLTYSKLIYYILFSILYWFVGSFSQLVMVNGTWTGNHIKQLWRKTFNKDMYLLYPPVDTTTRQKIPLNIKQRKDIILSIAQFRPEKDHELQLHSLHELVLNHPEHKKKTKMIMVGSCRDQQDRDRVESLKQLARELQVFEMLEFHIGVSATALDKLLAEATVGIHTMWCEHFGIGVVELMSAGVITIGHNSGGPKEDIIIHESTGFLASTKQEYAEYIHRVLSNKQSYSSMQEKARESTNRFSQEMFIDSFIEITNRLLPKNNKIKSN